MENDVDFFLSFHNGTMTKYLPANLKENQCATARTRQLVTSLLFHGSVFGKLRFVAQLVV